MTLVNLLILLRSTHLHTADKMTINIVKKILSEDYASAKDDVVATLKDKMSRAMNAVKKRIAATDYSDKPTLRSMSGKKLNKLKVEPKEHVKEEEQLDEARVGIVAARVRGGVIQRRKKVSLVPGMTFRGGKLTRMSPAERRRRKMGARRAKMKIQAKRSQMLRKRKLSMAKRSRLGL